jgi:hypothetical protein
VGTVRWLWDKFVTRPARRFPHYFGVVVWFSLLGLLAFPFTLGFGEPWWWVWVVPWLALLAGFLWWYGWLPGKRPQELADP